MQSLLLPLDVLMDAPTVRQFLAVAGVPMEPAPLRPELPAAKRISMSWFSHEKTSTLRALAVYLKG